MDIKEFKQQIKPYRAILGFDFGTKRLGVAVSDLLMMVGSSYKIIQRKDLKSDIAEIKTIIKKKEVGGIVYGLPLQMDGQEGETSAQVRKFAEQIAKEIDLPYTFWDERMSSKAMESFLIKEVDMSRKKRKEILDSSSASYILQGFLDALRIA